MNPSRMIRSAGIALLLLVFALPAWSAEMVPMPRRPAGHSWILPYDGPQDVGLSVSSLEWGSPDRWSFTSRYIHMFDKESVRDHKPWLHSLTVSAIPGISGGRLGIGYGNMYGRLALPLLSEARVVLLRTWGRPLVTGADRTFVGAEVRTSLTGVVNVGTGYYWPISGDDGDGFWGFHVGVGA